LTCEDAAQGSHARFKDARPNFLLIVDDDIGFSGQTSLRIGMLM
jgi:hypothetical protein